MDKNSSNGANLGFEEKLWQAADKLRNKAENIFWLPQEARWEYLQKNAKKSEIGKLIDEAMDAIERGNPSLKGVLPKNYVRPALDKQRLGELIDLIGTIGLGDSESKAKDILGRVIVKVLAEIDENVQWGDSFHNDLHKDLKADFILANPPFNDSDWKSELLREDVRWKFGMILLNGGLLK